MKHQPTLPLVAVLYMLLLVSCYYDKEEQLYPDKITSCDTVGVISYATRVQPIFAQHCYSCHSSSIASGGVVMGNFILDRTIASSGKLYGSISHAAGYSPMPQGTAKLSSCNVALIKKWIDAGSLNN
jgi:hypothetical protein